jgi:guanylate kinase
MKGQIYVISGPSGVGKSTIIGALRERFPEIGYSVSHTSRAPRPNEKDGLDYHFIDSDRFRDMIDNDAFVEWATVYGDYYGTSRAGLKKQTDKGVDVILDVDSLGAANIRDNFQNSLLIYILPPSLRDLEKRLELRATDKDETIKKRIALAQKELKNCEWYDYIIINDVLEKTITNIEAIIISNRCSKNRMLPEIRKKFQI